jgi:chromosome partitioning protein
VVLGAKMTQVGGAHVVVVGNEKGGAGKSTVAMHLTVALLKMGMPVGAIDLDLRQRTFSRYLDNRSRYAATKGIALPMPEIGLIHASTNRNLDQAENEDLSLFDATLSRLTRTCKFIVIDAPGGDTFLSRRAHVAADTLITPLNDSFVDFDLLGDVNADTLEVTQPSFYSEMVWECRKKKAAATRRPLDWIVMRNRMSPLDARNKQAVGDALKSLANRIGFRMAPGLSERVIFRQLFPYGLTLLDLAEDGGQVAFTMSHVAARQELRDLLIVLKLPGLEGQQIGF